MGPLSQFGRPRSLCCINTPFVTFGVALFLCTGHGVPWCLLLQCRSYSLWMSLESVRNLVNNLETQLRGYLALNAVKTESRSALFGMKKCLQWHKDVFGACKQKGCFCFRKLKLAGGR
ncbi:hypothetical protein CEXT_498931 [Caerostris extrusa]|uniref:Secreted protein n=1 Tax=Caerostris extrusa TaxID=172846 RepID=A0AAV4Y3N4_CAEEX|nr:hypothetical protein CEXT_498931 [Caerostris extrusa]